MLDFPLLDLINILTGCTKLRNEILRNATKRNEILRNATKRNEILRNATQRNEIN